MIKNSAIHLKQNYFKYFQSGDSDWFGPENSRDDFKKIQFFLSLYFWKETYYFLIAVLPIAIELELKVA